MSEVEWTLADKRIKRLARECVHGLNTRCSMAMNHEADERGWGKHTDGCNKGAAVVEEAIREALREALRPHADVQESEPLVLYFPDDESRKEFAGIVVSQMKNVRTEIL